MDGGHCISSMKPVHVLRVDRQCPRPRHGGGRLLAVQLRDVELLLPGEGRAHLVG